MKSEILPWLFARELILANVDPAAVEHDVRLVCSNIRPGSNKQRRAALCDPRAAGQRRRQKAVRRCR